MLLHCIAIDSMLSALYRHIAVAKVGYYTTQIEYCVGLFMILSCSFSDNLRAKCSCRPIQQHPSSHSSGHTQHHSHSARAAHVHCILGLRKFPPSCSGLQLVHCQPKILSFVSPTLHLFSQLNRGVIFRMVVEGLRLQFP